MRRTARGITVAAALSLLQLLDLFLVRQRRTFFGVLAVAFLAVVVVTFALPKQYRAESTLSVGEDRPSPTGGDTVQLDDVLARTYVSLLQTPDVEDAVVRALPFRLSRDELASDTSVQAITGTRLISIAVLARDPAQAQQIAAAYGDTFVQRQQQSAVTASQGQLAGLRARIGALAREVAGLRGAADVPRRALAETELTATRDAYVSAQQNAILAGSNVSVASRATLPGSPAKPRPKLYLALGLVVALLLAAGTALLRNLFDERVRDEDELLALMHAPILARIPVARPGRDLATQEALDVLCVNLRAADPMGERQVIAVSSALPNDGKTTLVAELGLGFARLGMRVATVDCDLRRRALTEASGALGAAGVINLLVESQADLDELVAPTSHPGVWLLPAGPIIPNPSALLGTARLSGVLRQLRQRYDYVLLDTPPVTQGADVTEIASVVDGVVLVADLARSRRRALLGAREQLARADGRVLGLALNRVPDRGDAYGSGYGAGRAFEPGPGDRLATPDPTAPA